MQREAKRKTQRAGQTKAGKQREREMCRQIRLVLGACLWFRILRVLTAELGKRGC